MFLDQTIAVFHLTPDSPGANTEGYVADGALAAISCNIQPQDPYQTNQYGGAYSSAYNLFTTASGIVEGDLITVSGTNQQFVVKGKNAFLYGPGQHLEYVVDEVIR